MRFSTITFLTSAPLVILLQVVAVLFDLYQRSRFVGVGLAFFTTAVIVLGLYAAHSERIIPFQTRPPRAGSSSLVAFVVAALIVSGTAQAGYGDLVSIGTMGTVAACLFGAYTGSLIGTRLMTVLL